MNFITWTFCISICQFLNCINATNITEDSINSNINRQISSDEEWYNLEVQKLNLMQRLIDVKGKQNEKLENDLYQCQMTVHAAERNIVSLKRTIERQKLIIQRNVRSLSI